MKPRRLPAWAVFGTVIFFELIVLKDLCPMPWQALVDGLCGVVGLYLAIAIGVVVSGWFTGPGGSTGAATRRGDSVGVPSGPGNGGIVFRYRLHSPDGDDLGEATYAVVVKPGEEIFVGNGRRLRVLDVVPIEEEDSALTGLLKVEAA
jgi:hypothetical protein